jgi:hypothetical protein
MFVAEPAANLVSRIIVSDDGTTLRSKKAYADAEFSRDDGIPAGLPLSAPDGANARQRIPTGIIRTRASSRNLRDQILSRKLDQPSGHGRIYRIVHDTTKRDRKPALSKATPAQLVDTLSHPNGWWRDTAQRLLVERADRSVAKALTEKAEKATDWRTRLHALWTLDGLDAIEPATITRALADGSRDVRVSAPRSPIGGWRSLSIRFRLPC